MDDKKKKVIERINRIEGQVRGLRTMIMEDKPCFDVLKQVSAVRGALRSLAQVILKEHMQKCIAEIRSSNKDLEEFQQHILKIFSKIYSSE
ncbi:MAG: metal-sensitive transcriptional regulator [Candidatus Hydrogenedentes bacterium]|nr:metal-sensitive transcriptional regulator [Candidatus Hydrogenedentota bacterium]